MSINLENAAKKAASWPYTVKISKEECTDGQIRYLAAHPELIGCIAQGERAEEAMENLQEVTYEYILSLLEDGIPIPLPSSRLTGTRTGTTLSIIKEVILGEPFSDTQPEVDQLCAGQEVVVVEEVSVG